MENNCGSCKEWDGAHCTRWWNNLDPSYYIPWRDDKEETDSCEEWEADNEPAPTDP